MRFRLFRIVGCIFLPVCLLALTRGATAQHQEQEVRVKWAGEMHHVMHKGDLSTHASLDTLLNLPHLVALGPVAGMKGEITVINSTAFVTRAKGTTASTEEVKDADASFLVYAQVPKWKSVPLPTWVRDQQTLIQYAERIAKEEKYLISNPFPFMVSGQVNSAQIHVVNKQDKEPHTHDNHEKIKVYFQIPANTPVTLVGFFSVRHQGVFTHHDSFAHLHLVTDDKKLSGHLDQLQLKPGKCSLLIPDWPASQRKKKRLKLHHPKHPYKDPTY